MLQCIHTHTHIYICIYTYIYGLPAMQETQVRSLGREDSWRKEWQLTPVFLPGEFHGQSTKVGSVHGVTKSWTRLNNYHFHFHFIYIYYIYIYIYIHTHTHTYIHTYISVQFSRSVVSDSAAPWTAARQAPLSITNCWSPSKPMSIESVMPSNHLILCHPLLFLPSIFPSIRVFSNESPLRIAWPKY